MHSDTHSYYLISYQLSIMIVVCCTFEQFFSINLYTCIIKLEQNVISFNLRRFTVGCSVLGKFIEAYIFENKYSFVITNLSSKHIFGSRMPTSFYEKIHEPCDGKKKEGISIRCRLH